MDPARHRRPGAARRLPGDSRRRGLELDQCIAVDDNGRVVTFNPSVPGAASARGLPGADARYDIACPTATSCVAVDAVGNGFVGHAPG